MSSFFGGARGREDPELAAGNRRTRLHYARDVNDQRALADDTPPIRRGRNWTWFAAAVVVMAVLGFAGSRGAEEVPITADCDTPGIAVASSQVTAGQALRFRLTGPDDTDYVVTLDGAPAVTDPVRLTDCASATLSLSAPPRAGRHELAMLAVADDGTTRQVTAVTLTVTR